MCFHLVNTYISSLKVAKGVFNNVKLGVGMSQHQKKSNRDWSESNYIIRTAFDPDYDDSKNPCVFSCFHRRFLIRNNNKHRLRLR